MIDPHTELAFMNRVLGVFAAARRHSDLLWHIRDGRVHFSANVSDVFAWGGGDAEEITADTLPVLEQAFADLEPVDGDGYLAELYAARIRHMRPQSAAYPDFSSAVQELFNACGPERSLGLGNPKPIPATTDG